MSDIVWLGQIYALVNMIRSANNGPKPASVMDLPMAEAAPGVPRPSTLPRSKSAFRTGKVIPSNRYGEHFAISPTRTQRYPFDLTVDPKMIGFGQAMLDAVSCLANAMLPDLIRRFWRRVLLLVSPIARSGIQFPRQ